jgi:hypothetical protein
LLNRINLIWPVQPHQQKYSPSRLTQISSVVALSRPTEGRIAIVTYAGRDAVDAAALKHAMGLQGGVQPVSDRSACRREMLLRTAKSCGPDASTPASSLAEACRPDRARTSHIREMTVTIKPITKESAKETVKTIACGNAG